jgi:transposase
MPTVAKKTSIMRQSIGIDVSSKTLSLCFQVRDAGNKTTIISTKKVDNNLAGFKEISQWITKWLNTNVECVAVMEATGSYHERVAYYLSDNHSQLKVSVVLANKVKHFAKTLDNKSKTDELDAKMLSQMGLEKNLSQWIKPDREIRFLRDLTRERAGLIQMRTRLTNELHAFENSQEVFEDIILRQKEIIVFIEQKIQESEYSIKKHIKSNKIIAHSIELLTDIPGIGETTAAVLVAECDNFALFSNQRQLASYAGLDVVHRESGTSVKGKTRISKKGNSHIRSCLYLPALSHIRSKGIYRKNYDNIVERRGIKMVGVTAVQRKLLTLAFTLVKKNIKYDSKYSWTPTPKSKDKVADNATQGISV